jgi:hypothetical protein
VRKSTFTTICNVQISSEAETLLGLLRGAGLHPVDLSLTTPLALAGAEQSFSIQVPNEEADAARALFEACRKVS